MNWREWVFQRAKNSSLITAIVNEDYIFEAMAIEEIPEVKPFLSLVFGDDNPQFQGVVSQQRFTAWCHDRPGSYLQIDSVLAAFREEFVGQVSDPGAYCVEWDGDSGDLEDTGMKTIVRTSSYHVLTRH